MATLTSYRQSLAALANSIRNLVVGIDSLYKEVENGATMASIASRYLFYRNNINGVVDQFNDLYEQYKTDPELSAADRRDLDPTFDTYENEILEAQSKLESIPRIADRNARQQIQQQEERQRQVEETVPKNSSGAQVQNEAQGQEADAKTQTPNPVPSQAGIPQGKASNASGTNTQIEDPQLGESSGSSQVGGNRTPRTQTQTQNGSLASNSDDAYGTRNDAVASAIDDTGIEEFQAEVDGAENTVPVADAFTQQIRSSENRLRKFSSVTYNISMYLQNTDEQGRQIDDPKKGLDRAGTLLIASGGIPVGKRNPYFDVDFFIENLNLYTVIGTQAANDTNLRGTLGFQIFEPNGITFLERLRLAVAQHTGLDKATARNTLGQSFLFVIRFYGYDENGNLISGAQQGEGEQVSDRNAIVEKWIPFRISKLTFRITGEGTTYDVTGYFTGMTGIQMKAGSLPFNITMQGSSVKEMLAGDGAVVEQQPSNVVGTTGLSPAFQPTINLDAAISDFKNNKIVPRGTARGLINIMNEHEQRLKQQGIIEVPNDYNIVFEDAQGLADATFLQQKSFSDKRKAVGVLQSGTPEEAIKYDKAQRSWTAQAGMSIAQVIDYLLRNSSYVSNQSSVTYDQRTGLPRANSNNAPTVQWYKIRTQVKQKEYDRVKQDYGYNITYIISRYQINTPNSPYYPPAIFRGVHKNYNYWFTGENTEVLDFQVESNTEYYAPISYDGLSVQDAGYFPLQQSFETSTLESQQGSDNRATIPGASLASRLYNIADVAKSSIEIIGDPDWIIQDGVFYQSLNLGAFNEDGSVNSSAGEVLFQINFNRISDYDLNTGLTLNQLYNQDTVRDGATINDTSDSLIFGAHTVTSTFSNGVFKQEIEGTFRHFRSARNAPLTGNNQVQRDAVPDFDDGDTNDIAQVAANSKALAGTNTTSAAPTEVRRLSNGSTTNFNVKQAIDSGQNYVDVPINGKLTRVYGTDDQLRDYVGASTTNEDAGDVI